MLLYNLIRAIIYPAGIRWFIIPLCVIALGLDTFAMYRLFALTGKDKRKAFLPFANVVTLYQLAWQERFGVFCCVAEAVYAVLSLVNLITFDNSSVGIPAALCIIAAYILQFFMKAKKDARTKTAKRIKKSGYGKDVTILMK